MLDMLNIFVVSVTDLFTGVEFVVEHNLFSNTVI